MRTTEGGSTANGTQPEPMSVTVPVSVGMPTEVRQVDYESTELNPPEDQYHTRRGRVVNKPKRLIET